MDNQPNVTCGSYTRTIYGSVGPPAEVFDFRGFDSVAFDLNGMKLPMALLLLRGIQRPGLLVPEEVIVRKDAASGDYFLLVELNCQNLPCPPSSAVGDHAGVHPSSQEEPLLFPSVSRAANWWT